MNSNYYKIYINDELVSNYMPLQYALILVKGIYAEFYAEPNLKVTIERDSYGTEAVNDDD